MEKRKVMQLGRSSLVVSLPQDWIKMANVKQGNVVTLEINGDRSISIYPNADRSKEDKDITLYVDPSEDRLSVGRSIIACYLNGYSSIKLISRKIFSVSQQRSIRKIARNLYIQIVEADAKNMNLSILMDESKASIESNIHRMYSISRSMCRDVIISLVEKNRNLARAVYSLDDDVDQFCFFLLRLLRKVVVDPSLAKKLDIDFIDCQDYQILVHRIEHIADHATTIANQIIMLENEKLNIPNKLLKLIFASGNGAIDLYEKSIQSFFSKDIATCNEIIEMHKKIEELDRDIASETFLTSQLNAKVVCSICSIRDAIFRISEWAVAIAHSAILRSYYLK